MNVSVKTTLECQHGSSFFALLGKLAHSAVRYGERGITGFATRRTKNHSHQNFLGICVHSGYQDFVFPRQVHRPMLGCGRFAVNTYFFSLMSSSKQASNPAPVIFLATSGCWRNHSAASDKKLTFLTASSNILQACLEVKDRLICAMMILSLGIVSWSVPCNQMVSIPKTNPHPSPRPQGDQSFPWCRQSLHHTRRWS